MKSIYLCPMCNEPLKIHQESQGLHCSNKHHFDQSEHGYWVFSLAKKPKTDSRQVMRGKRFLLESDVLAPLTDKIAQMLQQTLQSPQGQASDTGEMLKQLDYDCGEGHYLRSLRDAATGYNNAGSNLSLEQYGICEAENSLFAAAKISKDQAEERAPDGETASLDIDDKQGITYIVSNLKSLPFATESFDLITLIDKHLKGKELVRVLKSEGILLQVSPAPRHLWQIREHVYGEQLKVKELIIPKVAGMELLQTERVTFELNIGGEQALSFLDMTPYAWRANEKIRKAIAADSFDKLDIDFVITLSKKIA